MGDPAAQRVWDAALGQLQIHVTKPNYDTWLKDTQGLRLGDGQFVVGVPTEFVKEWLATRMRTVVSQTVGGILGQPTDIAFEIIGGNGNGKTPVAVVRENFPLGSGSHGQAVISSPVQRQRLNPRYTFHSFVVADSNRMAMAARQRRGSRLQPAVHLQHPARQGHLLHRPTRTRDAPQRCTSQRSSSPTSS